MLTTRRLALLIATFALPAVAVFNCSDSTSTTTAGTASGGSGTTGTNSNSGGTTGNYTGTGGPPTEIAPCQGMVYECGDLIDNDGDGLIDSQDPDCLGPCHNSESSYFGSIPGQAGPPCLVDCYFDFDSGQGNDQCYWAHWCDPNSVAPDYYPESCNGALCAYQQNKMVPVSDGAPKSCDELYTAQAQECYDYCGPLTPNGCDCFGCCELPAGSGQYVFLGSDDDCNQATGGTCDKDSVNDPSKCQPCLPVQACLNDCEPCEYCLGKTELPPECFEPDGGDNPEQCADGVQPCGGPGQDPCQQNYYCVTGCCVAVPT